MTRSVARRTCSHIAALAVGLLGCGGGSSIDVDSGGPVPDAGCRSERCDGVLDDDCDGTVDEGCSCRGSSRPCGTDVGECSPGSQVCRDERWETCAGAVGPSPELCDCLDNDCDGDIDGDAASASCASVGPHEVRPAHCVCGDFFDGPDIRTGAVCSGVCATGWADCDGRIESGCEVNLNDDPENCGDCDSICGYPKGATCMAGACDCEPGWFDCGGECTDLEWDPYNCGDCGYECGRGTCAGGSCTCEAGLSDCSYGCVDLGADPLNCGSCANECPFDETCVDGACVAPP